MDLNCGNPILMGSLTDQRAELDLYHLGLTLLAGLIISVCDGVPYRPVILVSRSLAVGE